MRSFQSLLTILGISYTLFLVSSNAQAQFWGSPNMKGHVLNYQVTASLGDSTSIEQKSVISIVRRKNLGEWKYAIHGPGFEIDVTEHEAVTVSRFPNIYDKSYTFRGNAVMDDISENSILAAGSSKRRVAVKGRVLLTHSGMLQGFEFSYKTEDLANNQFIGLAVTDRVAEHFRSRIKNYVDR